MENEIKDIYLALLKGYEREYYIAHKTQRAVLIPRIFGSVKEEDREPVYKKALESGKTWEEIAGKIDERLII